jgi:hypothetical protein
MSSKRTPASLEVLLVLLPRSFLSNMLLLVAGDVREGSMTG